MERIWLEHYPPGVAKDLDLDPQETLVDSFESTVAAWADHPAFHNLGHTLTYADIDQLTLQFAAYMQNDLGLQPGDRVAIMMPNLLQYPVALFGCLRAGLIVVNVNPLYTARELEHQLIDCGAKALVVYAGSAHVFAEVKHATDVEHVLVTEPGDLLPRFRRLLVNAVVRYVRKIIPAYSIPEAKKFRSILGARVGSYRRPE
jgi:long-chain acyl-CoA synthetase